MTTIGTWGTKDIGIYGLQLPTCQHPQAGLSDSKRAE